MRRTATTLMPLDATEFISPAQRIWLERAIEFSGSKEQTEDWSFLKIFTSHPEAPQELIERYSEDNSE